MTLEQIEEIKTFLRSKGLDDEAIDRAVKSITYQEIKPEELNMGPDTTENINEVDMHQEERVKRFCEEIKKFGELRKEAPTYINTLKSDEKIRAAMNGWSKERNTEFPGAKHGEEWLKKQQEEQIKDSGDVMFGVDFETQGLGGINLVDLNLVDLQEADKSNKNVSQDEDKIPQGYYKYSSILKRMDDTHTRKNNDYGDAAYQGYKKYGDFYFLVQLHNKFSRLESLTVENYTQMVKDESIDDTLLDMANYAIMFLESRHRKD